MAKKDFTHIKEVAQILFLQGYKQKEISEKMGISQQSLTRWVKDGHWDTLKTSLLTSKNERISELYAELAELNLKIKSKEEGNRFADSKEADIRRKLIADIADLEQKYNIGQTTVIARDFVMFIKEVEYDFAEKATEYFDLFINHLINKQKWQGQ